MAPLPVEVVRSTRRRKTVQAELRDGVIRVHVPARLTQREIDGYVAELVPRLERRFRADHVDLVQRAATLARRYRLPVPATVSWSDHQRRRWGSCSIQSRDIRLSARLADYPPWVLDYVLVHELAHLVVPDHGAAFQELVDRYPRAERARGFLIAKQDDPPDDAAGPSPTELDVDVDEPCPDTGVADEGDELAGPDGTEPGRRALQGRLEL